MESLLSNVVAIVNEGSADAVMEVAKDNGARGGTIISANGSVAQDAVKLYGIDIHPGKEIVLILVSNSISEKIISALYDKLGSNSEAMGVFFTLPVTFASSNLLNQYE